MYTYFTELIEGEIIDHNVPLNEGIPAKEIKFLESLVMQDEIVRNPPINEEVLDNIK